MGGDLCHQHANWLALNVGCRNESILLPVIDLRIFAIQGSKEIGLKSVCMDRGWESLVAGITSADFQIGGTYPWQIEALNITASGW